VTSTAARLVRAQNIPEELRAPRQWVVWRPVERDGKVTKVPYRAAEPERLASSTDPATWSTFEQVCAAVAAGRAAGAGFVFTEGDPYVGVDFDRCRDPESGAIEPAFRKAINTLAGYAEASPSGTGVHVIVRGWLPGSGKKRGRVELYDRGRFFTMTGAALKGAAIAERQREIDVLYATLVRQEAPQQSLPRPTVPVDLEDRELLERARQARNGATFTQLYDGGWQGAGYGSQSEGDLALCAMLAFWTGRDEARVDRLFRGSGLTRAKWDERRGALTYGEMTIQKAIEGCREVYAPRAARSQARVSPPRMVVPRVRVPRIRAPRVDVPRVNSSGRG
jgi:putative DNA primase/helicase